MSKFRFGDVVRNIINDDIFVVSGHHEDDGCLICLSKDDGMLWSIEEHLLVYADGETKDKPRIEWLFENLVSERDKQAMFGDYGSLDNFRARLDVLMLESE